MTANGDAFLRWAMSEERTVEERFSVLLLIENWVRDFMSYSHEARQFDREARKYNPAWVPELNAAEVRSLAGKVDTAKALSLQVFEDRPVRSLEVLRFMPNLEALSHIEGVKDLEPLRHVPQLKTLSFGIKAEVEDLTPLRHLPELTSLSLGSHMLEDYRPVAFCRKLKEVSVYCRFSWPRMEGWEALTELEKLSWRGSALGFLDLKCLPALRLLDLHCGNLFTGEGGLRDLGQLPEMPELRVLWARHFCYLDGIDRYSKVQSALLGGSFRTAAPVVALKELTHLRLESDELRDVRPLAQAPALHDLAVISKRPQDYSVLMEAPQLREVHAFGCDSAQVDLDMLAVMLPRWDEYFAAEVPRPLGELELIGPPAGEKFPKVPPADWPVTEAEREQNPCFQISAGVWFMGHLRASLDAAGFHHDEGFITGMFESQLRNRKAKSGCFTNTPGPKNREVTLHVLGLPALARFKKLVNCVRSVLAGLQHPWLVRFHGNPTPDEDDWGHEREWKETEESRQREEREAEEKRRKEQEFLAQELRLKLLQEEGIEPNAKDFGLKQPPPSPGKNQGGVATLTKAAEPDDDEDDDDPPTIPFDAPNLDWSDRDDEDDAKGGLKDPDPKDEASDEHWLKPPPHLEPNVFWDGLNLYCHLTENAFYVSERSLETVRYLLSREA